MKCNVVLGLGFGDEGKGSVVDYLTHKENIDWVVKYNGGPQAAHNVVRNDGTHHTFATFGSGTFNGVPTYLTHSFLVDPVAITREGIVLSKKLDTELNRVFHNLYINTACKVITPFAILLNKIKETYRERNRHGSCGCGIGETEKYYLDYGIDSVFVSDIIYDNGIIARDKLRLFRQRAILESQKYINKDTTKYINDIVTTDIDAWLKLSREVLSMCYMLNNIPPNAKNIIAEGGQGLLLDEYVGFHPYTTWSSIVPRGLCEELDIIKSTVKCDIKVTGVIRSYHTRHGNGPFPSYMKNKVAPGDHNSSNDWQGDFRVGAFDVPLFNYALKCMHIDNVFLTCMDHIVDDKMDICWSYRDKNNGRIVDEISPPVCPNLEAQEKLADYLMYDYEPCFDTTPTSNFIDFVSKQVPIKGMSFGPKTGDKQ